MITPKRLQELQKDANEGVASPEDVKALVAQIQAYRGVLEDFYSMYMSFRNEQRKRGVLRAELVAIMRYIRRTSYLYLRSKDNK